MHDSPVTRATVWSADYSATVDLSRCVGPHFGVGPPPACLTGNAAVGVLDLAEAAHKIRLYECCLSRGTPFDIYRWINLPDLADLWYRLRLPPGVRAEWGGVLGQLGLLRR